MKTTKERLQDFAKHMDYGRNRFEEHVGISSGYLSSKSVTVASDVIEKVAFHFPSLDINWLITGTGDMYKHNNAGRDNKVGDGNKRDVRSKDLSVYRLKTDYYDIEKQEIPLYDLDASAGLSTLFSSQVKQIPLDFIRIPNAPNVDGAMYVRGDSMYPILKSGDIVCYKTINNLENIRFGEMYLIYINDGDDEYLTIKYIQKSDKGNEFITLVSQNDHHQPKCERMENIKAVAIVKISIRHNTLI